MHSQTSHNRRKILIRLEDKTTKKVYKIYISFEVTLTGQGVKVSVI